MSDGMRTNGREGDADEVLNVQSGTSRHVVQARDIYGSVHVEGSRGWRTWLLPAAIVGVALLMGAMIVAWPHQNADVRAQNPEDLRVTADLSANDQAPWGYVSTSPGFPGDDLVRELGQDGAATNRDLTKRIRLLDTWSFQMQTIRLHLEGPADRSAQVVDIRPVMRASGPPLSGTLVQVPPQASPAESSQTHLLLDEPFPVLRDTRLNSVNERVAAEPYFPGKTIKLAPGETHEVVITVFAQLHSHEYTLSVVEQAGSAMREIVVDDNGRPFRVTGPSCTAPGTASYGAAYVLATGFRVTARPNPGEIPGFPPCRATPG